MRSVQLAQRHLQPGALAGDLVHAVQFEVDELTDAQTGRSLQQQRIGGQPLGPGMQRWVRRRSRSGVR